MGETTPPPFTPAPWEWRGCDLVGANGHLVIDDGSGGLEYRPPIDTGGPDARLIAAAPDLYAALKALLEQAEDDVDDCRLSNAVFHARATLAKADGR